MVVTATRWHAVPAGDEAVTGGESRSSRRFGKRLMFPCFLPFTLHHDAQRAMMAQAQRAESRGNDMTPQERHYARLGRAEHQKQAERLPEPAGYDWRAVAAASAAILIGVVAGEVSTAWIAEQAERAVQTQ